MTPEESPLPSTETAAKTVKKHPIELGCSRASAISFKGHIVSQSEGGDVAIRSYIATYRETAVRFVEFMVSMANAGGDDRLVAYLIANPGRVPDDIRQTTVWREVVGDEKNDAGWKRIVSTSTPYYLLRALVDPDARSTKGGAALVDVIAKYGLRQTKITRDAVDAIFASFDLDGIISALSTAAMGVVKSFLSNREIAAEMKRERTAVIERLLAEQGAFFNPFLRFYRTQGAWGAACRHFKDLRKTLRGEGVEPAIVAACQWTAVLARPDLAAWQPDERPEDEFLSLAGANPDILKRFEAGMPASLTADFSMVDRFRRLSSSSSSWKDLAREPAILNRVLSLHQTVFGTLSPKEVEELVISKGEKGARHVGWLKIGDPANKDPRHKAIRKFVLGEVRAFCAAMKPMSDDIRLKVDDLWPLLSCGRYGWEETEERVAGAPSNALFADIYIPAHRFVVGPTKVPAQKVQVRVRGNIPGERATKLPAPIDIMNGTTQYRPDRIMPMPGDSSRKIYLKYQALRLTFEKEGQQRLFGSFAATIMPEIAPDSAASAAELRQKRVDAKEAKQTLGSDVTKHVAVGERVATIHVCPGGLRAATLIMFERVNPSPDCPTGWKQVPFDHLVRRTDNGAYRGQGPDRRRVFNAGLRTDMVLHFNADFLDVAFEERQSPLARGFVTTTANELNMQMLGAYRTNVGKVFYRGIARKIADACARNGVGHVLAGGAGIIIGASHTRHPARDFYTIAKIAGRQTPQGYLVSALAKAGVMLHATSARASVLLNSGWRSGVSKELPVCVVLHDETRREGDTIVHTAVAKGKKNLIVDPARVAAGEDWLNAAECFSTNAAWAILLGWHDEAFKKAAEAILAAEPEVNVALPNIAVHRARAA